MDDKETKELRAALTWDTLVEIAKRETFIQYGELADKIGLTHPRPLRHYLKILQSYCLENKLPPLTILAADESGVPGQGFIAWDADNIEEGKRKVYGYNWMNLSNPFAFAKAGLTEKEIIKELLTNPDNTKEIYSKIKVRGTAQSIFRKALLKAYNNQCAVCGSTLDFLLEACHIIPWSQTKKDDRLDVRNGILLCANHHKLFDNGYFFVNDDYTIDLGIQGQENESDNSILSLTSKKKIKLPTKVTLWPKLDNLKHHRDAKIKSVKIASA
jgi:putative restriction endonuclease